MNFSSRVALALTAFAVACGFSSSAFAQDAAPSVSAAEAAPDSGGVTNNRPYRQGFTMELGLGAALTHVAPTGAKSETSFGLAPLSVSVGGFVSPNVAVLARAAGTSYFGHQPNGDFTQYANAFYGVHVQYWVSDELMISGGPGVMVFGENRFFAPASSASVGYGASVRVAYSFFNVKHHSVRAAVEAFPAKYDDGFAFGTALNLEWQYF